MRDFIVFLIFVTVVFFGVGEWRGWFVGITGQTPVLVYKSDFVASTSRRTLNRDEMEIRVSGRVRDGSVTVRVYYDDIGSFQNGRQGRGLRLVFEELYATGQSIAIDRLVEEGRGEYTVELWFDDATGVFRVPMPGQSQL